MIYLPKQPKFDIMEMIVIIFRPFFCQINVIRACIYTYRLRLEIC